MDTPTLLKCSRFFLDRMRIMMILKVDIVTTDKDDDNDEDYSEYGHIHLAQN